MSENHGSLAPELVETIPIPTQSRERPFLLSDDACLMSSITCEGLDVNYLCLTLLYMLERADSEHMRLLYKRLGSANQLLPHSVQNDLGRVMQIQLLHQVGTVAFDRISADVEESRNFLVRLAFCK